jgi:hypothetical protein
VVLAVAENDDLFHLAAAELVLRRNHRAAAFGQKGPGQDFRLRDGRQADGAGEDHLRAEQDRHVRFIAEQIDDHPALAIGELPLQQRRGGKGTQDQVSYVDGCSRCSRANLIDEVRRNRRGEHILPAIGIRPEWHVVERPVVAERRELPQRLKADQLRQLIVRSGRRGKKSQLDIGPPDGDQGVHPRQPALRERLADRRTNLRLGSRRAVLLRQGNDKRLLDDDAAAARSGDGHAGFFRIPFKCKLASHYSSEKSTPNVSTA